MEVDINKIENRLLEEDDRIESYLKGQMSGEEDQAFLRELEEKPEMKERAIIMARLIKGLKEVGTAQERENIGAILASNKQSVENETKNKQKTIPTSNHNSNITPTCLKKYKKEQTNKKKT